MPLFLITSLYDEGISPNLVRVVEADSALAVAAHMLYHPEQWEYFLYRSFKEDLPIGSLTPEALLERINQTWVDGDSSAQLRITPITAQPLEAITTTPSFQPGAIFSDFG
ncbi:hypothetical protein H6G89_32630 [Oscillatoria sp. FACHB-1407]|uniref:hypothetical protein n=1 Tax=Oscillatoria sp. FACHB-1407 TaxID=2692847 RepID=UPI0016865975|nr:hypothetical protein [Oscillatoria sp. FACHB-1407]MBD2465736.1 hypothetical protein [Oscillatoria sp. FACHB-1407]